MNLDSFKKISDTSRQVEELLKCMQKKKKIKAIDNNSKLIYAKVCQRH